MRGLAGMMNALAQTGQGALEGYQLGRQWKEEDRLRQQQEADRARQIAQQNRQTAIQDLEIGLKFGDQARASEAAERAGLGGLNLDDHFRQQKQAKWTATMAEIDKLPLTKDQKFAEMKRRHPDWEPLSMPVTKDVMIPGYANVQERVAIPQAPGISDELPGRPQGATQYTTQNVRKPIMERVEQAKPQGLVGPMPAEERHKLFPAKLTKNEPVIPFSDPKLEAKAFAEGQYFRDEKGNITYLPRKLDPNKVLESEVSIQNNNADNATSERNSQRSLQGTLGAASIGAQSREGVAGMTNDTRMKIAELNARNKLEVANLREAMRRARELAKATGKGMGRLEYERFVLSSRKTIDGFNSELAQLQDPMNFLPQEYKDFRTNELIWQRQELLNDLAVLERDFKGQSGLAPGKVPSRPTPLLPAQPAPAPAPAPAPGPTPNPAVDLIMRGIDAHLGK